MSCVWHNGQALLEACVKLDIKRGRFQKKVKWKKMNFTTDLPKINPQVKYLVATGKLISIIYLLYLLKKGKKTKGNYYCYIYSEINFATDDIGKIKYKKASLR